MFEPRSGIRKSKDYVIVSCCFSVLAAWKRKRKTDLLENRIFVFEWSDMFTRGLILQWAYIDSRVPIDRNKCLWVNTIQKNSTQRVGLFQSRHRSIIISSNVSCSRHGIAEIYIAQQLDNNYSLLIHSRSVCSCAEITFLKMSNVMIENSPVQTFRTSLYNCVVYRVH